MTADNAKKLIISLFLGASLAAPVFAFADHSRDHAIQQIRANLTRLLSDLASARGQQNVIDKVAAEFSGIVAKMPLALRAATSAGVSAQSQPAGSLSAALELLNKSASSDARCRTLFDIAGNSLNMPHPEGPISGDSVFCGKYYLVWIDRTGFYGEMNGLWQLNAQTGDFLDFVEKDSLGRPVNMLIVAEHYDGRWAPGSAGAEHTELLNRTAETDDSLACERLNGFCNMYALPEAGRITSGNIPLPWWSSCNSGKPGFLDRFYPVTVANIADGNGIKMVFEGRLAKVSDNDGTYDCDNSHADWLFPDKQRRLLYLRAGYELYGDKPVLVRTFQIRNPEGNPKPGIGDFGRNPYLVRGFALTELRNPPSEKAFGSYLRPEDVSRQDAVHGLVLQKDQFNYHRIDAGQSVLNLETSDEYIGGHPMTVSAVSGEQPGKTFRFWHEGNPGDQVCVCYAHNTLNAEGDALEDMWNVAGGRMSAEDRFNLELFPRSRPFPVAAVNGAQFMSQTVPPAMAAGKPYSVSIVMKNTGNTIWTKSAGYSLGFPNDQKSLGWGVSRVSLDSGDSIMSGQQKTFMFSITPPAVPGTYDFQWRMLKEGSEWFGNFSSAVRVIVNATGGGIKDDFAYAGGGELYGIGLNNELFHYINGAWNAVGAGGKIRDAFHLAASNALYGIGTDNAIWKWDIAAQQWSKIADCCVKDDFHFLSESNIYGIGMDNQIWHWNGSSWNQESEGGKIQHKIWYVDGNHIYGIGMDNQVWRWGSAGGWTQITSNGKIKDDFHFVSESDIYGIGLDNRIWRYANGEWTVYAHGGKLQHGFQFVDSNVIYGIGMDNAIWKWDGVGWSQAAPVSD